jgi:TrmH family RNA methyltransferase
VVTGDKEDLEALKARGVKLLAAVGSGVGSEHTMDLTEFDLTDSVAVMIGNEGAGLSQEWLQTAQAQITIPCAGPVESLNAGVAASIILYEAHRRRALVGVRP